MLQSHRRPSLRRQLLLRGPRKCPQETSADRSSQSHSGPLLPPILLPPTLHLPCALHPQALGPRRRIGRSLQVTQARWQSRCAGSHRRAWSELRGGSHLLTGSWLRAAGRTEQGADSACALPYQGTHHLHFSSSLDRRGSWGLQNRWGHYRRKTNQSLPLRIMHIHRGYTLHLWNRQIFWRERCLNGVKYTKDVWKSGWKESYLLRTWVCASEYPLGCPSRKGKLCHDRFACQVVGPAKLEHLHPPFYPASGEERQHLRACSHRHPLISPLWERFGGIAEGAAGNEEPEQSGAPSQADQLTVTRFPYHNILFNVIVHI